MSDESQMINRDLSESAKMSNDFEKSKFSLGGLLPNIASIISIYLSVHYFYSYLWFQMFFAEMGLGGFPLINFDDLTYPFGLYNLNVIVIGSTSMIGVFFFYFMKMDIKELINSFKQINWNKRSKIKLMIFLIILSASIVGIYFLYKNVKWDYPDYIVLYILLFVCPILFLFLIPEYKKEIITGTWILTLVWGVSLINYIVKDRTKTPNNLKKFKLSFVCNKDTIGRDTADHYAHFGYKTIIMRNSITNKYRIYPVEQVSNIEYGEIK